MPKLTAKQKRHMSDLAYNRQYEELFKLHKFLVDCPLSNHSICQGNPVDDAIELMTSLLSDTDGVLLKAITRLEKTIDTLKTCDKWKDIDTAPTDGTEVLLKVANSTSSGYYIALAKYGHPTDAYGIPRPNEVSEKLWVRRRSGTPQYEALWHIRPIEWQSI